MTLAELVVASSIGMLVMTLAVTFFVNSGNLSNKTVLTNQVMSDARNTLDSWTSSLRVADWLDQDTRTDRFEEITPTKVVFYASIGNRSTSNLVVGNRTKIVLMLRVTDASSGDGQLVEMRFAADNTTPTSVRQLSFNAAATNGAAVFQPYNQVAGPVDVVNTMGCLRGSTPAPGLCLQSPPSGAGMLDPTLATGSLSVRQPSLPLHGNPAVNVDSVLQGVGGISVNFTVRDPAHIANVDLSGSASVSSGYPS